MKRRKLEEDDKKCLQIICPHELIRKNYINCFDKNLKYKKPGPEIPCNT
jgi:hypothetical protein